MVSKSTQSTMRRTFLAIIAAAISIVACNKTEVIEQTPRQKITFGKAFIDNATKVVDPTYSGSKALEEFNVWGTVTGKENTVNVFNGATCTGYVGLNVWNCNQSEYWIPWCVYNFTAIADADDVKVDDYGMPTEIHVTSDGTKDLLYATASAETDGNATPSQSPVNFTFAHKMSKAHFTFENNIGSDDYAFVISEIYVSKLYTKGVYTIGAATPWSVSEVSDANLSFGAGDYGTPETLSLANGKTATSNLARTFLPAEYGESNKFTVSFTAYILYKGTTISEKPYTLNVAHTFVEGHAYNFVIGLEAGNKITFSVTNLNGWTEDDPVTVN